MSIESLYIRYHNFCDDLRDISDFKSNEVYQGILEHVTFELGEKYLYCLRNESCLDDEIIKEFCIINDKVGGGKKYNYDFITTSPSNFRYLFHAHLIFTHMIKSGINNVNIAEIGSGYGGLCLAITQLSSLYKIKINTYNLIDLPACLKLQKMYLAQHNLSCTIEFYSSFDYGKNISLDNLFLISNYCFSEISKVHQENYIKFLFPKVSHGFLVWNHIPFYNFGFECRLENEKPMTAPSNISQYNKYVYF